MEFIRFRFPKERLKNNIIKKVRDVKEAYAVTNFFSCSGFMGVQS